MTTGPEDHRRAAAARRGQLKASQADREGVIDAVKAAFVAGRLTEDEFSARIGQALALSASITSSRSACAALSWSRPVAAALPWSSGPVVTGASREAELDKSVTRGHSGENRS